MAFLPSTPPPPPAPVRQDMVVNGTREFRAKLTDALKSCDSGVRVILELKDVSRKVVGRYELTKIEDL